MPDRLCLQGILYVLHQDVAWQLLPLELGFGSGQTCWRRLDRWQKAGVFEQLHRILLAKLHASSKLDWTRVRGRVPRPLRATPPVSTARRSLDRSTLTAPESRRRSCYELYGLSVDEFVRDVILDAATDPFRDALEQAADTIAGRAVEIQHAYAR
ncbi:putative transposase of IS4/5 family DUF4096 [Streptomyces sp. SLBN-115]|nr:putative transposase of IS4/5 family DUF4096 [Streptomyces sp. SLBN-115]